ncbi:surface-adhesin E family protein [Leptothermofonsia sp. ETS-13]|uniref:surface-adhesin E family protein n=1 Tax=Leptothermofonsia sp. ETS-13 TaxID=3035696 RepID=UPI003BA2FC5B
MVGFVMLSILQKLGCTAGVTIFLLGVVGFAEAAPDKKGWVAVFTDRSDKTWYVDNGSIQGHGRFRYFWSYTTGGTPYRENGKLAYSMAFYLSVDCQQKRFRLRYAKSLDENSNTIKEYNFGDSLPLGSPRSDSGEEASMNYVCASR